MKEIKNGRLAMVRRMLCLLPAGPAPLHDFFFLCSLSQHVRLVLNDEEIVRLGHERSTNGPGNGC